MATPGTPNPTRSPEVLRLTYEDVARFPRPGMAVPERIAFRPDGRVVTFLHSPRVGLARDLWQVDLATGAQSILLAAADLGGGVTEATVSRDEALRRERERLLATGITHYEWAEAAPVLLVRVGGDVYVLRDGHLRCVARGATDAAISRDGTLVAFVRAGELYAAGVGGTGGVVGAERRLTHDARPGVTNGLAEFIAQEEMGRRRGFWISPDGAAIAFAQVDERHIPVYRIPHLAKGPRASEAHRYPFAGAANARVRLGVVPAAGGPVSWLDLGGAEYLARVDWRKDSQLFVQLQTRDQRRLELRAYDPATGRHRTLLVEEAAAWINLHDDLRVLEGGEYVWASERTGFKHLYLYREDTLIRPLTSGAWAVDAVLGVDDAGRYVFFTAARESPLERHVYRVPLAGGAPERLSDEPGMHDAAVARDGAALVERYDSRTRPPQVVVRALEPTGPIDARGPEGPDELDGPDESDGAARRGHAGQGSRPATGPRGGTGHASLVVHEPPALDFPAPELLTFPSRDGETLYAALYRPATVPAPLVVAVYGGPRAQSVEDSWALTVDLRAQLLARRGFAVLKVDNRGSARRGVAFETALHRRLGTVEVDDQVDGVRHLVARGVADPARVGVYGWSYGGYMALLCLMRAPDVFRAGVAGAPVVEWEGYDTHYTERYMETPRANPEGYRRGSVLTHAGNLAGKLLLVHGMIDENVHFRHSARLLDALVKAGKPPELLLFPDERHLPRSERDRAALEARIVHFFETHLA